MYKYESREDIVAHLDAEGLYYWLFDYGAEPEQMPDEELRELMVDINDKVKSLKPLFSEFMRKLPEYKY